MKHKIDPWPYYIYCSCGWTYVKPFFRGSSRSNKAIARHLREAKEEEDNG